MSTLEIVFADGVYTLRLSRPDVHNALNAALFAELSGAIARIDADPDARAVVLTGAGRSFCAGADLDELTGLGAEAAHRLLSRGQAVLRALEALGVPVIGAVNGAALGGGCELALACDFLLAADDARFALPESGLGLMPGYGGTQRLPLLIGAHAARFAMLTGRPIGAERAYQLGLVALPPVPAGELASLAREVAAEVAGRSVAANAAILAATSTSRARDAGLDLEAALAAIAVSGSHAAEGIAAFRERRRPGFQGGAT
ncbi:crotonase [Actinomadura sp. NBRC 104412]|uniref:enoyl-CoA hydratase/isomerase family protein n=1 Tax=Actinomadura sp. NBRC 104412 TaxID=3032203 RepID=UPI0024A2E4A8|nr:enoyl-CoA hydratase/isomerase family protein [Actinomadura sp. NBRC 104412]GLZ07504.1 crotonase [Actinomadura sp. NBRC 104412]